MSEHCCFWILIDGRVIAPDLHIQAVVSDPEKFGESEEGIQESFQKYGQNPESNVESKAREEVLLRVIRRNHIRIRKYTLKCCQQFSIQLYRLTDERRSSISGWAKTIATDGDQFADVVIHQLYDNSKMKTSLNLIKDGTICGDTP